MNVWLVIGLCISAFAAIGIRNNKTKLLLYGLFMLLICGLYTYYSWNNIWWACMICLPLISVAIAMLSNFIIDLYATVHNKRARMGVDENWCVKLNDTDNLCAIVNDARPDQRECPRIREAKTKDLDYALCIVTDSVTASNIRETLLSLSCELISNNQSTVLDLKKTLIFTVSTLLNIPPDHPIHPSINSNTIYTNLFNITFEILATTNHKSHEK